VGRRFTTQAVWLQGPTLWCHALGVAVRCACLWCKLGVCRGRPHSEGRRCAAIHARSRFLVCVFLIVRGMPLQAVRLAKPWTTPRHAYPNQPVNQSQHMLSGHVRKQQEQQQQLKGAAIMFGWLGWQPGAVDNGRQLRSSTPNRGEEAVAALCPLGVFICVTNLHH